MANFHHYHLHLNHLKMIRSKQSKKINNFAQQQLQSMDRLQQARVQCRATSSEQQLVQQFPKDENGQKLRKKKKKKRLHFQGQATMSPAIFGTLTSKTGLESPDQWLPSCDM